MSGLFAIVQNKDLQTKWLVLPVEIVERELQGKLMLAIEAIQQGWQCIIGTKHAVLDASDQLSPGVVLLKSVIPSELHKMNLLKDAGHLLASLDEEGLVQTSLERMARMRYSDETVKATDLFLCWGDIQRQVLSDAFPDHSKKFRTSGSPRTDLWHPKMHDFYKSDTTAIKEHFGPYIFLPSSFGWPNHYMGAEAALEILLTDKMISQGEDLDYFRHYQAHAAKVFSGFLDFLPRLAAAFPEHTIIIRPHPSEAVATWHKAAAGLENVKVIFEGSVTPWLLAADAILHWGSTTGIEAHLMGKPVIAYSPVSIAESEQYDLKVPHSISIVTRTPEEAISTLNDVLARPNNIAARYSAVADGHENLKNWIFAMESGDATGHVLKNLDTLPLKTGSVPSILTKTELSPREMVWKSIEILAGYTFLRGLLPDRIQKGLETRSYGRHKTKDIDHDVLQENLLALNSLKGSQDIKVRKLAHNLYALGPGQ